ncbi:YaaL family protein [Listeria sp. FSL L7-1582]|uniref:YaaL family protein n=1 Tax=Listeria rustica TaxID=2713503 RepID=A0A7W1YGN0_9LIST|nr:MULTISPECIES: YaaL family protein [Listeria]MBA3926955.1 YaaL family protein [Listeria rustica]MBC6308533.1 YaaL family protein [Listeria portnoyi]
METRSDKNAKSPRKKKQKIGKMHQSYDAYLVELIEVTQEKWNQHRDIARKSFGYNSETEYELKKAEAKYFYLFREARHRNLRNSPK